MTTALLETLQALEVELHHPGVRCSRERLQALLHPEFHEVGRSGRAYTRQTVIEHLLREDHVPPDVRPDAFELAMLGPDAALLSYRSLQLTASGERVLHTLRSSLWLCRDGRWQLRYHQGTPAAQAW